MNLFRASLATFVASILFLGLGLTTLLRKVRYPALQSVVHRDWHPKERKDRFPSVDERVKLYMSDWYLPPCDASFRFGYKVTPSSESLEYTTVDIQQPKLDGANLGDTDKLRISSEPIHHKCLFVQNSTILADCADGKFHHYKGMCSDLAKDAKILAVDMPGTPVLTYLGDSAPDHLALKEGVRAPYLAKYRAASSKKDLLGVTTFGTRNCISAENRSRLRWSSLHREEFERMSSAQDTPLVFAPIIWKLESERHFGPHLSNVTKNVAAWENKIPKAIWRGALTGGLVQGAPKGIEGAQQSCPYIPRCNFVQRYINASDTMDVGLVGGGKRAISIWAQENGMNKDKMTIKEQLQYKILVSLEGNDVTSGLKWMLLSNSVVLMPPPTLTSWAMEELLEPFVHYVPMAEDGSDAEEKVQWILDNDMEAQRIAERATLFMEDMLYHPDAEKDELEVKKEIVRRYRAHWQPIGKNFFSFGAFWGLEFCGLSTGHTYFDFLLFL